MDNEQQTVQCSRCKKRFFEAGFKINRLGRRLKTCLECNVRQVVKQERNKCAHGRQRSRCRECGGSSICAHGRQRSRCRECGGSSICEHSRYRYQCRECGGSSICDHSRIRSQCRECGGSSICEHSRRRSDCRECGGSSVCEHSRYRYHCRECGGVGICPHDRQRDKCWTCDPVGALWHRANARIVAAIGTEARAGRSTETLLGCNKETYFNHIGAQFVDGMTWARIGEIDIDHRVPIEYPGAAGGPPTLEEKVARLDYRNCQPLWAPDNRAKGNRWADEPLPEAPQPEPPAPTPKIPHLTDDEVTTLLAEFGF